LVCYIDQQTVSGVTEKPTDVPFVLDIAFSISPIDLDVFFAFESIAKSVVLVA
jgi:hypothetical protein